MPSIGGTACSPEKAAHAVYRRPGMQSIGAGHAVYRRKGMQSIYSSACSLKEAEHAVYKRQSIQTIDGSACSL